MLIDWKESYRTGIDEVDYEHRELIDLINELWAQLNAAAPRIEPAAFFGDITRAISAHFALEERLMRERGYTELGAHKTDHERLLDEIRQIADDWERGRSAGGREGLGKALDDWFSLHFRSYDSRLHRALGPHPHP